MAEEDRKSTLSPAATTSSAPPARSKAEEIADLDQRLRAYIANNMEQRHAAQLAANTPSPTAAAQLQIAEKLSEEQQPLMLLREKQRDINADKFIQEPRHNRLGYYGGTTDATPPADDHGNKRGAYYGGTSDDKLYADDRDSNRRDSNDSYVTWGSDFSNVSELSSARSSLLSENNDDDVFYSARDSLRSNIFEDGSERSQSIRRRSDTRDDVLSVDGNYEELADTRRVSGASVQESAWTTLFSRVTDFFKRAWDNLRGKTSSDNKTKNGAEEALAANLIPENDNDRLPDIRRASGTSTRESMRNSMARYSTNDDIYTTRAASRQGNVMGAEQDLEGRDRLSGIRRASSSSTLGSIHEGMARDNSAGNDILATNAALRRSNVVGAEQEGHLEDENRPSGTRRSSTSSAQGSIHDGIVEHADSTNGYIPTAEQTASRQSNMTNAEQGQDLRAFAPEEELRQPVHTRQDQDIAIEEGVRQGETAQRNVPDNPNKNPDANQKPRTMLATLFSNITGFFKGAWSSASGQASKNAGNKHKTTEKAQAEGYPSGNLIQEAAQDRALATDANAPQNRDEETFEEMSARISGAKLRQRPQLDGLPKELEARIIPGDQPSATGKASAQGAAPVNPATTRGSVDDIQSLAPANAAQTQQDQGQATDAGALQNMDADASREVVARANKVELRKERPELRRERPLAGMFEYTHQQPEAIITQGNQPSATDKESVNSQPAIPVNPARESAYNIQKAAQTPQDQAQSTSAGTPQGEKRFSAKLEPKPKVAPKPQTPLNRRGAFRNAPGQQRGGNSGRTNS